MTRRSLSTSARVKVFEAHGGKCHLCGQKIQAGELWDCEHVIALALGGADDPSNMAPAHRSCHRGKGSKTSDDQTRIAKAKRQQAKHIGAKVKGTWGAGRNTKWKQRIGGGVVER